MGYKAMRYKRGHTRQDGMMFWSYRYNDEIWLTQENFIKRHQQKLAWQRKNVDPIQNRKNVMEWTKNNLVQVVKVELVVEVVAVVLELPEVVEVMEEMD